VFERV